MPQDAESEDQVEEQARLRIETQRAGEHPGAEPDEQRNDQRLLRVRRERDRDRTVDGDRADYGHQRESQGLGTIETPGKFTAVSAMNDGNSGSVA